MKKRRLGGILAAVICAAGLLILHVKSLNNYPHLIKIGDETFVCHMKKVDAVDESLILGTITGFIEPPVFPDEDESTNVRQFVGQPYAADGDAFYVTDGKHWYVCSSASQYADSTGFWAEFFTPNRFHRFDKLQESIDRGDDMEQAIEAYYARIRPYLSEDAYQKLVMGRMLFRYDTICREGLNGINLPFKFEKVQASEEKSYNFHVTMYNEDRTKILKFNGSCTEDPDGTITSFYLDLDTLSGDISSIKDVSSFPRQEYDAYVAEMKTQYLNTVNGGVSEGVVSYSQGYPILNCGDPYKRTYFLFIDGICKGQLTASYVKGECASSFVYKDIPEVTTLYEGNTAFNLITTGQSLYAYYEGGSTLVQGEIEQTMADQVLFQELVETHHDELQAIRLE